MVRQIDVINWVRNPVPLGEESSNPIPEPSDTTAPTAPSGLQATPTSVSQIDITWTAAEDLESGIGLYNVYRDGVKIGSAGLTSISDSGLEEAAAYIYEVSAINGVGIEGPKSTPVTQSTLDDTVRPTIERVTSSGDPNRVIVEFSEKLEESSVTNINNYSIDNGISIGVASLGSDSKTVTLTTTRHVEGITYTLTVSNIKDRAKTPNAIAPNSEFAYEYIDTIEVEVISVASGKTYEVVNGGLNTGAQVFVDRDYTFTAVPDSVTGATYIQTANDDKVTTGESLLTFTVNRDATVYVGYDMRANSLPDWMADWTTTGETLGNTDSAKQLYFKGFQGGTVTLGGNLASGASGAQSNYSVIIVGTQSRYPIFEGMNSPVQDLDNDGRTEDINGNGRLDFADIVILFEQWNSPNVQDNPTLFDFNGNEGLDLQDMVALFEILIE